MAKSTQDKAILQEYTEKLIQMTNGFCDSYLDEEYKALCEKLIRKMSRKRVVPFLSGKKEILDKSPFSNVFLNGMPIPVSSLPRELQEVARANPKKALTIWSIDKEE